MRKWISSRRLAFAHWRRDHHWTSRAALCRVGIHVTRTWEPAPENCRAEEELICQSCRYRLDVRVSPDRPPASLAAVSGLSKRHEGSG